MSAALTLAPMSPAVAKIWHQLQAAMLKETHGLDVVPTGAIVLSPLSIGFEFRSHHDGSAIVLSIGDGRDNVDAFTKYVEMPNGWENFWNPAHWHLTMARTDKQGRRWSTSEGAYVMDDFGDLVPVSA